MDYLDLHKLFAAECEWDVTGFGAGTWTMRIIRSQPVLLQAASSDEHVAFRDLDGCSDGHVVMACSYGHVAV